jgi:biopolymer transport protein ExbD
MPIVIIVHRDKLHGLPLQIAYQEKECFDNRRLVIAQVLANGKVSFNGGELVIQRSELADRLHEIFKTRAERLLFIEGDPDLPVSSVAEVIDISRKEVAFVVILTPAVESGYCLSVHPPWGIL